MAAVELHTGQHTLAVFDTTGLPFDNVYVVVDGREKSVVLYDIDGNATDAYALRQRGARGSGSYVFERVAPGYNAVAWDNSFGFEVRAYVERSAPKWTI